MFTQLDLLQLILLFSAALWCIGLIIAIATHHASGYMTWTGQALKASFKHAWQLKCGLFFGYIMVYSGPDFLVSLLEFIILMPLVVLLITAAFQVHKKYLKWLGASGKWIWQKGWQIIVGIAIGYILHSNTLVSLHFGSY